MKETHTLHLISVIVTVYNIEAFIGRCIDSIIAQTYKNLEIILVDDGSTDDSGKICDYYAKKDARIKVIHKINGGTVSARKAGILAATGEYAAYVDGDDWIENNMYEKMIQEIEDADVVISGIVRDYKSNSVREINKIPTGIYQGESLDIVYKSMIYTGKFFERGILPQLYNSLYKKDLLLINQIQVPDEIRVGEDPTCLYTLLLDAKKIKLISDTFYHYVMRNDSIMGVKDTNELERYKIFYQYLKKRFGEDLRNKDELLKQLDYLLLYFLLIKELRVLQCEKNTIFPYDGIPKGSRVVIYGTGRFGKEFVHYLNVSKVLSVVLWVDSGDERKLKEYIATEEYDYIIIAVLIEEIAKNIEHSLLNFGIVSERIKRINADQIEKGREKVSNLLRS